MLLPLIFPLFLLLRIVKASSCDASYYARPISNEEAFKFDFYYTAVNLSSVKECAVFCGERRFCRSAIYDSSIRSCAISYEWAENCRIQKVRYNEENPLEERTLLISCISKCREHKEYEIRRSPVKQPVKVDIITGEPHDGFTQRTSKMNPLKELKRRREQIFLRKSPNAMGQRGARIIVGTPNDMTETTASTVIPTTTSQSIVSPLESSAEMNQTVLDGYINRVILSNVSLISPDIRRSQPKGQRSPVCFRTKKGRYLLGGSFRHHPHTTIDHCRCLCANAWRDSHQCDSINYYNNGMCVLNSGSHRGRFDLIDDGMATYQYVDCDITMLIGISDIVCDNNDMHTPTATKVFSKVWKESRESTTSPSSSSSTEDSTESPMSTESTETSSESAESTTEIASSSVSTEQSTESPTSTEGNSVEETESTTEVTSTTTEKKEENQEKNSVEEKKENEKDKAKGLTDGVEKENEEKTAEIEEKEKEVKEETSTKAKETTETSTEETEEKEKEEEDKGKEEESKAVSKEKLTRKKVKPARKAIETQKKEEKKNCYEELFDYVMTSTAGGLEHDVSMDECKCLCANSMTSGRYAFQCRSATYYHNERDCVLNVESRRQRPELLERHYRKTYNVTYLGLQCSIMEAVMTLVDGQLEAGCIQPFPSTKRTTTTTTTTTQAPKKRQIETASDYCFLELPHFVLEGTAQAVESDVTVDECKCSCADAEERYGEPCQSAQYFSEERICLLNKKNRFSNPESFNYVPLSPQSYYESKCISREKERKRYIEEQCSAFLKRDKTRKLEKDGSPEKIETPQELKERRGRVTVSESEESEEEDVKDEEEKETKDDEENEVTEKEEKKESEETVTQKSKKMQKKKKVPLQDDEKKEDKKNEKKDIVVKKKKQSEKEENESENEKRTTKKAKTTTVKPSTTTTPMGTTQRPRSTTTRYRDTVKINYGIPETEGFDDEELAELMLEEEMVPMSKEVMDDVMEEAMKNGEGTTSDENLDDNSVMDDSPGEVDYMSSTESSEEEEEEEKEGSGDGKRTTVAVKRDTTTVPTTTVSTTTLPTTQTTTTTKTTTAEPSTTTKKKRRTTTTGTTTVQPTTENTTTEKWRRLEVVEEEGNKKTRVEEKKNQEEEEDTVVKHTPSTRPPSTTTVIPSTTTETPSTTESPSTTTQYPPAGPCTYSAIYQTAFNGNKLIKRVEVSSPSECFSACYALGCRSANLFASGGCQLFKDALIDYRRADIVAYERGAVYFDGIRCEGPKETEKKE